MQALVAPRLNILRAALFAWCDAQIEIFREKFILVQYG